MSRNLIPWQHTPGQTRAANLEHLLKFKHVWTAYEQFRDETGLQRPNSRSCATCNKKFAQRTRLKQCSGHCPKDKKPVYCSRKCQKERWPKHRQWCKVETVGSDSEWTTDSEREVWEHSDGEGPPSPPDIPEGYKVHVTI
ncbi:hypothetical protein GALMADRAFT_1313297 [Galerina marginata CBS 339.88]|uniref:MYND-type domain-containing protein n=1 Tax=Galerina marginata (strain CBS 339.88) TaxID=685588 RepID=A0A067T7I4_GALM3|nr:hypothetical protein GALMADRAFT_1313297 [Galerina marginata CBS 339.88]